MLQNFESDSMTDRRTCKISSKFYHGQALTDQMRSVHHTAQFTAVLSRSGTQFISSEELAGHMVKAHHAYLVVETR